MIGFKKYLVEYLTDAQRARYANVKMTDKARSDTDHFFGTNNDIVHGSLHSLTDKSEIHKKVESHLGKELTHDEYRSGITKDNYGRDARIGRMIKDQKLRDEFARDPVREGSRSGQSQYTTSTVRGTEVAGQTNSAPDAQHPNGHSWGGISCKNVDTGINKHYLEDEVRHGTVVHRVHDHNGQEIYRATLQPYHNEHSGNVVYSLDAEYGIKHPSFTADSHRVAQELSHPKISHGLYIKHPKVYNDNDQLLTLHPNATKEDLHKSLLSDNTAEKKLAVQHPNTDETHLKAAFADRSPRNDRVRVVAARHHKMTDELLHSALNDPDPKVRRAAASNPNIKESHITKAIQDDDEITRAKIYGNPATPAHHIIKATKDKSPLIREAALRDSRIPVEHVLKGLRDEDQFVRAAATENSNVKGEHLTKMLGDSSEITRRAVFNNPNATTTHITMGKNDPSVIVRMGAAKHKNTTDEQLHQFLDDPDGNVHEAVMINPNAKPEHIRRAMNSSSWTVRHEAARHPNAPHDVLMKAVQDEDDTVVQAALDNPNIAKEHLDFVAKNYPYYRDHVKNVRRVRALR